MYPSAIQTRYCLIEWSAVVETGRRRRDVRHELNLPAGDNAVEPSETGPRRRSIWGALLMPLLVTGFAVAFLWDGFVRYPRQNAAELFRRQGQTGESLPSADARLTAHLARDHIAALPAGTPDSDVIARLGEPSLRAGDRLFYLGHGGALHVELRAGLVEQAGWEDALHSATDLAVQRWIGAILAVASVVLLGRWGVSLMAASNPRTTASSNSRDQ